MLDTPLIDLPLAVIDVETTGSAFAYGDRVTEIGVARVEGGRVAATVQQLVDPGRPISRGAAAVTGISDVMVRGQPTFADAWPAVRPLLAGAVIVGHNVQFDLSFFDGECRRGVGNPLAGEIGDFAVLDTVRLARRQFGRGGNGLQRLAARLDVPVVTAHRALADCLTTAAVLEKILSVHGGWHVTLRQAIALQGGVARRLPTPTPVRATDDAAGPALVAGQKVCITYLDAGKIPSRRTVTPMYVRRLRGTVTLYAWCHLRNAQRTFRVDRILAAVPAVDDTPADDGSYTLDYVESEP